MYRINKLVGTFLALMVFATMFGVAYAMWSETLKVNVTVNTGEVDIEWSSVECNDEGIDPGYDKDVASCNVRIIDLEEEEAAKIHVEISNAYPCYTVVITGVVDNVGTIPVKLIGITLDGMEIEPCTEYELDLDGDESPDLSVHVEFVDLENDGTQIDPDKADEFRITIHVLQDAKEEWTYKFEMEFEYGQWNEVES